MKPCTSLLNIKTHINNVRNNSIMHLETKYNVPYNNLGFSVAY